MARNCPHHLTGTAQKEDDMFDIVEVRFKWTCPHCGFEQFGFATVKTKQGQCEPQFAYCDLEEGGCDRMVAIKPRLVVEATVYKLETVETEHFPHLDPVLDEMERMAEAEAA